jgi:hypothetical protein
MKITFTGSHGTGKTTAASILKKIINESYPELSVASLGSVTRSVIEWGGEMLNPDTNSFQLACIYERRRQMLSKNSLESNFVISERWAMDEVAYQLYRTRKNITEIYTSHTLKVCQMEMNWELENYWDRVYYIPVDERPVEEDGVRPGNKEYQVEVDKMLEIVMVPHIEDSKIKRMPTKLEEWELYFKKEVESWNTKK